MSGDPAIDRVLEALRSVIDAAVLRATVEIDRAADDALGNAEIAQGAINIVHRGTVYGAFDHATTLHRATVDIDIVAGAVPGVKIARAVRGMEADIVAGLHANRTLNGLAQDCTPISNGGDDDVFSDSGGWPLTVEILFLTPIGDHRSVIGTNGAIL